MILDSHSGGFRGFRTKTRDRDDEDGTQVVGMNPVSFCNI